MKIRNLHSLFLVPVWACFLLITRDFINANFQCSSIIEVQCQYAWHYNQATPRQQHPYSCQSNATTLTTSISICMALQPCHAKAATPIHLPIQRHYIHHSNVITHGTTTMSRQGSNAHTLANLTPLYMPLHPHDTPSTLSAKQLQLRLHLSFQFHSTTLAFPPPTLLPMKRLFKHFFSVLLSALCYKFFAWMQSKSYLRGTILKK